MLTVGTHPADNTLFIVYDEEGDHVAHARLVLDREGVPKPGETAPLSLRITWRKPAGAEGASEIETGGL